MKPTATATGYQCSRCGSWVAPYAYHHCAQPPLSTGPPPQTLWLAPDLTPELRRIADALERIAGALDAKDGQT